MLSNVGYLDVDRSVAVVRREYIGLTNTVLMKIRSDRSEMLDEGGDDLNEVGNLAEIRAVEHERNRLRHAGFPELSELVQRISTVDRNAGYDVLSYVGRGRDPTQEIHIEVKGTRAQKIGFIWTRNERYVANKLRKSYWIYVYTSVDISALSANGPVCINDPTLTLERLGYAQEPLDVFVTKRVRKRKVPASK